MLSRPYMAERFFARNLVKVYWLFQIKKALVICLSKALKDRFRV